MCGEWDLDIARRALPFIKGRPVVIEVGSRDVNGSVRGIIEPIAKSYLGLDIEMGPGVDRILDVMYLTAVMGRECCDLMVCTEVIEHVVNWIEPLCQMILATKVGGLILIATRSYGMPYHGYPVDCWRYEIEDFKGIFSPVGEVLMLEPDTIGDPGVGILVRRRLRGDLASWKVAMKEVALYSMVKNARVLCC